MISATLDTNVYIRGLRTGGLAAQILDHAKARDIRIDISDAILDECCGVLREKFRWDGYSIADAYQKVRAIGNRVVPGEALKVVKEDPDDDRILECAQAAGSDFIVSEDKDLLRLGSFGGAQIVTIREFLEIAAITFRRG